MIESPAFNRSKSREALQWYAEQVEGCRKLGRVGDHYRQALDRDGGERARIALSVGAGSLIRDLVAELETWEPELLEMLRSTPQAARMRELLRELTGAA